MNLNDLPPALQALAALDDDAWDMEEWLDYPAHGISPSLTPALIDIVRHTPEFWPAASDTAATPGEWLPLHAWRALGQLQALEALPALLDLLHFVDNDIVDSDLIQEEMPQVFAAYGPAAQPALTAFLQDPANGQWARLTAAEGLQKIGLQYPQTRLSVIEALSAELAHYSNANPTFNGLLVGCLTHLNAVEAAPLVQEAFLANQVDETVIGDWEDFQVGVGMLEKRLTPPKRVALPPYAFDDGISNPLIFEPHKAAHPETPKAKKKRKAAEASRRKNRKKKK